MTPDDFMLRAGPSLSAAEVQNLPRGTLVVVTWIGGNGPHVYRTWRDHRRPEKTLAYSAHCDDPTNYYLFNELTTDGDQRILHDVRCLERK